MYRITCAALWRRLRERYIAVVPERRETDRTHADHLAWMLIEIPKMEDREKASRWIGYVMGVMEAHRDLTNEESREIVRKDVALSAAPITRVYIPRVERKQRCNIVVDCDDAGEWEFLGTGIVSCSRHERLARRD